MDDSIYKQLRVLMDTLPQGFPETESGVEIKLLKKMFTEEEAEVALNLKLKWEKPEAIAQRTGIDGDYLTKILLEMHERGLIGSVKIGDMRLYKLVPYIVGIYEFQLNRLDNEYVHLAEEYMATAFGRHMHEKKPAHMRVIPIEKEISSKSSIETNQSLKYYIENAKSLAVGDCICKIEKRMLGQGCNHPTEVCIAVAPIENYYDDYFWGRPISKEEAFDILEMCEREGLVHMTNNVKDGPFIICNCCSCSCDIMRGLLEFGYNDAIATSNYIAVVSEDDCVSCGACEEKCHVKAIDFENTAVINERCIGCGLCVSACPVGAIEMIERAADDMPEIPQNETEWMELKDLSRGRNGEYKRLIK